MTQIQQYIFTLTFYLDIYLCALYIVGYYGLHNKGEEHIIETTMEKVRREIELCDAYSGCVVMHSLSGGTGSGLGSKLIEMLRDQYPMNHLMSCTFAPHASGESPLQNYNALLTLSTLQRNTDCVILTHNDDVLSRLQKSKESVSFTNINDNIAAALCGVFLPTDSLKPKSGISIGTEPWEMMRSICPMPGNKFVQLNHISRSKLSWESMVTQLLHSLKRHDAEGKHVSFIGIVTMFLKSECTMIHVVQCKFSSIASLAVGRGEGSVAFPQAVKSSERKLRSAYGFVPWNPFPLDVWTGSSVGKFPSVTVASNHGSIVEYLDLVRQRSKVKHAAGAYLHWYWRYGASEVKAKITFFVAVLFIVLVYQI
ncbi:hypothetical protein FSP39_010365 [Pinctada imbricata]|uniref:Tubulin delta chain n=1 Tax=Pinctada imbricata TaxID=66713 RepID=A0AA88XU52_PINIB|nr:hypothetical protein FSP39_010365 [Pinctada imbricata]